MDTATGKQIWKRKGVREILGIGKKAVYVRDEDKDLLALDKKTGKVAWRSSLGGFQDIYPNEEQYEKAGRPLHLLALTRKNEIVCLVEPGYKPPSLRSKKPDEVEKKIPVIRGKGTPTPPPATKPAAKKKKD